jgi:hypothetical protein
MCLCVCTFYAKICTKDMMIRNFMLVSIIARTLLFFKRECVLVKEKPCYCCSSKFSSRVLFLACVSNLCYNEQVNTGKSKLPCYVTPIMVVTGNQGSIPEREPEKRLPHPRGGVEGGLVGGVGGELKNNDTELLRDSVIGMSTLFKSFNEDLLQCSKQALQPQHVVVVHGRSSLVE